MNRRLANALGCGSALLVLATGCVTFEPLAEREARIRRDQQMSVQVARINSQWARRGQDLADLRAEVQVLREDQQRLTAELAASRQLSSQLRQRLDLTERQLASVDANYSKRVEQLRKSLAAERGTREAALKVAVDSMAKEFETTANKLQAEQKRMLDSVAGSPAGQREYTVVAGDCLSAIAQAFKVSIEGIKKANGLKSDLIREGQKLIIPASGGR